MIISTIQGEKPPHKLIRKFDYHVVLISCGKGD